MSAPLALALVLAGAPAGQSQPAVPVEAQAPAEPQGRDAAPVQQPVTPDGRDALTAASPVPSGATSPTQMAGQDDIVVSAPKHPASDPLERVNTVSYALTQKVDDAVTAPAARAYTRIVPRPVRRGIRNFLNNLREPIAAANYVLQLKPGKAAETAARFAINSTIGIGGVVDVARICPFDLPWRPNGFSDTLGFYGVGTGPYIFLPLIGPTTVRDIAGGFADRFVSPFALGGPFRTREYYVGVTTYHVVDRRAEQEDALRAERESPNPYAARRARYLKKRQDRVDRLHREDHSVAGAPDASASPDAPVSRCRRKTSR